MLGERFGGAWSSAPVELAEHAGEAGIVYCLSRNKVDRVAEWLCQQGINALPYHAGLSGPVREKHQQRFLREDDRALVLAAAGAPELLARMQGWRPRADQRWTPAEDADVSGGGDGR